MSGPTKEEDDASESKLTHGPVSWSSPTYDRLASCQQCKSYLWSDDGTPSHLCGSSLMLATVLQCIRSNEIDWNCSRPVENQRVTHLVPNSECQESLYQSFAIKNSSHCCWLSYSWAKTSLNIRTLSLFAFSFQSCGLSWVSSPFLVTVTMCSQKGNKLLFSLTLQSALRHSGKVLLLENTDERSRPWMNSRNVVTTRLENTRRYKGGGFLSICM